MSIETRESFEEYDNCIIAECIENPLVCLECGNDPMIKERKKG